MPCRNRLNCLNNLSRLNINLDRLKPSWLSRREEIRAQFLLNSSLLPHHIKDPHITRNMKISNSQMLNLLSLIIEFLQLLKDMTIRMKVCLNIKFSLWMAVTENRKTSLKKSQFRANICLSVAFLRVIWNLSPTLMKDWLSRPQTSSQDIMKFSHVLGQVSLHLPKLNLISITSILPNRQLKKTIRLKRRDMRDQLPAAINLDSITYLLTQGTRRTNKKEHMLSLLVGSIILRLTHTIKITQNTQCLRHLMELRRTHTLVMSNPPHLA